MRDWGVTVMIVRKILCANLLAFATSSLVIAGATVDRSVVSLTGQPGGGCSSACGVGAFGTAQSDNARGGYLTRPSSMFADTHLRSAGTEGSGLLDLSGATEGTLIGHGDDTTNAGRITGALGKCNGRCTFEEPG
jgi:hypothetical protein